VVEGGDDLVQEGDVEFFVKVEYAFHFLWWGQGRTNKCDVGGRGTLGMGHSAPGWDGRVESGPEGCCR
jgi:hypothetical protein